MISTTKPNKNRYQLISDIFPNDIELTPFLLTLLFQQSQKMDYGLGNKLIGREVDKKWWGTRTEHIVGVAGCLAVTDHASQGYLLSFHIYYTIYTIYLHLYVYTYTYRIFSKYLGRPLCFAKSPGPFVAHTFFFIFAGVLVYVAGDAALNPFHKVRG